MMNTSKMRSARYAGADIVFSSYTIYFPKNQFQLAYRKTTDRGVANFKGFVVAGGLMQETAEALCEFRLWPSLPNPARRESGGVGIPAEKRRRLPQGPGTSPARALEGEDQCR